MPVIEEGEDGTTPPRRRRSGSGTNTGGDGSGTTNTGGAGGSNNNNKDTRTKKKKPVTNEVLNPPFDPRMRKIGSPLNQSDQLKRGWIQNEKTLNRVNFMFNPSQLDVAHVVDNKATKSTLQAPDNGDKTNVFYTGSGSTTGLKLLYDRTYEMFGKSGTGAGRNLAHRYGVYADVLAWYRLVGLMKEEPENWEDTLIVEPAQLRTCFLFIGPRLVYYGWPTSLSVTYSHWTQNMIPVRCSVDVSFQILPYSGTSPKVDGKDSATITRLMNNYLDPTLSDPSSLLGAGAGALDDPSTVMSDALANNVPYGGYGYGPGVT